MLRLTDIKTRRRMDVPRARDHCSIDLHFGDTLHSIFIPTGTALPEVAEALRQWAEVMSKGEKAGA